VLFLFGRSSVPFQVSLFAHPAIAGQALQATSAESSLIYKLILNSYIYIAWNYKTNQLEKNIMSVKFSPLIVGTMRLGSWGVNMNTSEYEMFIDQCLELGLNDFDHADIYGDYSTEAAFGEVLKSRKDLRNKIQITTKCGIRMESSNRPDHYCKSYDSTAQHIEQSVNQSLKNFHTNYIDILLLHRPDYLMNPEEVAGIFDKLQSQGKVKYFGVSNFKPSQVTMLQKHTNLVTNQIELSLAQPNALNDGTLDQCIAEDIQATAWSPLGGGILFSKEDTVQKKRILAKTEGLCEKYNCSLDQLLIAWINKHPAGVIPVTGSSKILRIASALEALQIEISHQDWYDLYQASTGEIIP